MYGSDEWSYPFTDDYTGPYYSNGIFQGSVPFGKKKPKNKLAELSRIHDTAFALCDTLDCLDRADQLYYDDTRRFQDTQPRIIGALPKIANAPLRRVYQFLGRNENYVKPEYLEMSKIYNRLEKKNLKFSEIEQVVMSETYNRQQQNLKDEVSRINSENRVALGNAQVQGAIDQATYSKPINGLNVGSGGQLEPGSVGVYTGAYGGASSDIPVDNFRNYFTKRRRRRRRVYVM